MNPLLMLLAAMAISMVVIPTMVKLAPRLGMIDLPDPRKVHVNPIARVGGWGIIFGALIPFLLAQQLDLVMSTFVFGSLVLLVFGSLDDSRDLGHYVKFIGQFLAVIPVVYIGELYVERLPFFGAYVLDPMIAKPFTVFAMVGMINAINHSDGLDGLAGGESFLSLIVIALLAFIHLQGATSLDFIDAGSDVYYAAAILAISMAVIGGLLGFLRFNTHPAKVFMGDSGSQFLGFTLSFLAVLLTQRVDTGLSAALPALFLGLPIIDILAVLYLRVSGGLHWFKATRNHIHHRLLDRGFVHFECVVLIYSIQAFLVTSALFLRYAPDVVVAGLYVVVCVLLFASLSFAEKRDWRASSLKSLVRLERFIADLEQRRPVSSYALALVSIILPLYFLGSCVSLESVPRDFGWLSTLLLVLLALELFGLSKNLWLGRVTVYSTAMFVVYLTLPAESFVSGAGPAAVSQVFDYLFFGVLAVAVALAIKESQNDDFNLTPMDYLIMFIMIGISVSSFAFASAQVNSALIVKAVIILYACELILSRLKAGWRLVSIVVFASLALLSLRGLGSLTGLGWMA